MDGPQRRNDLARRRKAMRIAAYEGEGMRDLVSRLFNITGARAEARTREAEGALREANPHLRDLRRVPNGTPLIVPDVTGLRPSKESAPVGADLRGLVETVRESVGSVGDDLDEAARDQVDAMNRDLALLRSNEVKDLAASDRSVARTVRELTQASERRRDEAKEMRTAQAKALEQLGSDLEEFLLMHRGQ